MTFQRLQTVYLPTPFRRPSNTCKLLILLVLTAFQRLCAYILLPTPFQRLQVIDFVASNCLHTHTLYTTYIRAGRASGLARLEHGSEAVGLRPSIMASRSIAVRSMIEMVSIGLASIAKIAPVALVPMTKILWGRLCAEGGCPFSRSPRGGSQ